MNSSTNTSAPKRITTLPKAVANRICAGEVIHNPASVVKELVENCLDAKSTKIVFELGEGGLSLLSVTDNGSGIHKDDLPIICKRHTTSKIKSFDDLQCVSTFGFRGEALASISYIAHVSITSRTDDQVYGYRASFRNGDIIIPEGSSDEPKPAKCTAEKGTKIVIRDLFFRGRKRRQDFVANTEHIRCLDVISKYAAHNSHVQFTCKRETEQTPDIFTIPRSQSLPNVKTNILSLFGKKVGKELMSIEADDERYDIKVKGLISPETYSGHKFTMVLFINDRLVASSAIKRRLDKVYKRFLPTRGHPFVYLSLQLDARNLDVNIHPTKHEVLFLHETGILELIESAVETKLEEAKRESLGTTKNGSMSQTYLQLGSLGEQKNDGSSSSQSFGLLKQEYGDTETETAFDKYKKEKEKAYRPNKLVRTDSKNPSGRLAAFFKHPERGVLKKRSSSGDIETRQIQKRRRTVCNLTSVTTLLEELDKETDDGLKDMMKDHTYVGCVDGKCALIQYKTELFLVDIELLSEAFMYENVLRYFGNHPKLRLENPASVYELAKIAMDQDTKPGPDGLEAKKQKATEVANTLKMRSAMLNEYFSIEIDDRGNLLCLPNLVDDYIPPLGAMPQFVVDLALNTDWTQEQSCFQGVSKAIAQMFRVRAHLFMQNQYSSIEETLSQPADSDPSSTSSGGSSANTHRSKKLKNPAEWIIQHVLLPHFRAEFSPPKRLVSGGCVTRIAYLEEMYKIFERC